MKKGTDLFFAQIENENLFLDGDKVSIYDGYITIFSGTGEDAKIKRFIQTAIRTNEGEYITLNKCLELIGGYDNKPVTVIFESWTHGEIFEYGNHFDKDGKPVWLHKGETEGFV